MRKTKTGPMILVAQQNLRCVPRRIARSFNFFSMLFALLSAAHLLTVPVFGQEKAEEKRVLLRFITTADFPPFNYYDDEGILVGLNVDLARAICLELSLACDVRVRKWNELLPALQNGDADAVIAGHAINREIATQFAFTDRYFYTPGRFVVTRTSGLREISPEQLVGMQIGVVKNSAHEQFLKLFFRDSRIVTFDAEDQARAALRNGKLDTLFGDSVSLAFWLNGTMSQRCCEFRGGAYFEPKFFGEGLSILTKKSDEPELTGLINEALEHMRNTGRLNELILRYFPIRAY